MNWLRLTVLGCLTAGLAGCSSPASTRWRGEDEVYCVIFSPDGKTLAGGSGG